jgi:hypothetical protein
MAKAWSYWYPDLLMHVPGCPIPLAEHELRRTAQAFFKESRAWQDTLPLAPVVAGQDSVTVVFADVGQELVRVEQAFYDGASIGVTTTELLDAGFSDDWTLHYGTPFKIYQITPGVVRLYPIPSADAATGLKLRVSIRPSDLATGLADEMAVKYRDEIHLGAKARLMMYPNKPWTNMEMAAVYASAFDGVIGKANLSAARSFAVARKPANPKWC